VSKVATEAGYFHEGMLLKEHLPTTIAQQRTVTGNSWRRLRRPGSHTILMR
jgi:hypothetical protein